MPTVFAICFYGKIAPCSLELLRITNINNSFYVRCSDPPNYATSVAQLNARLKDVKMNASTLTFNNVELKTISHNNQIWMTSVELAKALGYAESDSVTRIFNRKKDEFSSSMTTVLLDGQINRPVDSSSIQRKIRYFSLRGCHLISMFAKTIIAKCFRVWVLDILDKETGQPVVADPINEPVVNQAAYTREMITVPMQTHLKHHVSTMLRATNMTHQKIWGRFCTHFRITRYPNLPIEKYPEACAYFGIKSVFEPEHTNNFTLAEKSGDDVAALKQTIKDLELRLEQEIVKRKEAEQSEQHMNKNVVKAINAIDEAMQALNG